MNMQNVINPAPESVYRKSRVGTDFSYTFNNLAPNGNYAIRLHFADPASRASGQRVFKVSANGNLMLNNFDIYANAGEFSRAVVKAISTTADSSGSITLRFQGLTGNAMVSGVEILPVISSVSTSATVKDANIVYTPTSLASISRTVNGRLGSFTTTNIFAQASDFMGSIRWGDGLLSDATITGGNGVFNVSGSHRYELGGDYTARVSLGYIAGMGIDSGSSVTTSDFISDRYFTDTPGKPASVVDTSILTVNTAYAKNSAPQQTYQSTRYGDFTYEIPNLTANALYKIRLNFVESKFHGPGQRLFDVAINDTKVMESYDVFSAAGSKNIAMGKTFFFN
ncbi:MAG: malectin domain-containing carbohydrate-binding protein, partial [bacterium]